MALTESKNLSIGTIVGIIIGSYCKIDKKYIKNIGDKTKIYNSIARRIEPFIKNKVVVDIGGGGKIFYNHKLD